MDYHRDETYQEEKELFRNMFLKRARVIAGFSQKKGKVLEVGCSTGVFLEIYQERGWEVWGIEPSKKAAGVAKKKGIKVLVKKIEKTFLPRNYFDLAILNHTLEHLEDPKKVLKKVNASLREKGIIFIDVPNVASLSSLVLGKNWPYLLPEEHRWQFTRKTLEGLVKEAGFRLLHWESRSGIFEYAQPARELWLSLIGFRKRFIKETLLIPYSLAATLTGRGDSMSVIGQKTK